MSTAAAPDRRTPRDLSVKCLKRSMFLAHGSPCSTWSKPVICPSTCMPSVPAEMSLLRRERSHIVRFGLNRPHNLAKRMQHFLPMLWCCSVAQAASLLHSQNCNRDIDAGAGTLVWQVDESCYNSTCTVSMALQCCFMSWQHVQTL